MTTPMRGPMVEGDGSAWDSCCSIELRNMIENPVLKHTAYHLKEYTRVPEQWEKEHANVNQKDKFCLIFKEKLMTYFVQLKAIRRSGHRGTSVIYLTPHLDNELVGFFTHVLREFNRCRDWLNAIDAS